MRCAPRLSGLPVKLLAVSLMGLAAWFYQAIEPPPPRICGSPNGPPVESPRVRLKDGGAAVHLWQGDDDRLVPVKLQRYVAARLHRVKLPGPEAHHHVPVQRLVLPLLSHLVLPPERNPHRLSNNGGVGRRAAALSGAFFLVAPITSSFRWTGGWRR